MLFQTWTFLFFFAVFYILFRSIKNSAGRQYLILAASFIFYGWFNPLYPLLLLWIIAADYIFLMFMEKTGKRKLFLVLSITNSLTLLGSFKYAGFITSNINELFEITGNTYRLPQPDILLPVGISFFIFISMGYVIDFYFGKVGRERNFGRHALFVSFFPQLSAGPIARASGLFPQLRSWDRGNSSDLAEGAYIFTRGLFKKAALADFFALYADKIFGNPSQFGSPDLVLGALAFTWQIYFDFSGYTDMARGIARCFGIELMENFRLPYMAVSTGDFWGRWHISLSSWFRDYLYIPLGGNRKGKITESRNTMITMLLSGLWHGAAWNFVLWGFIHGALHVIGKLIGRFRVIQIAPVFIRRIIVFILIVFTWIFFRAESGADAFNYIGGIFSSGYTAPSIPVLMSVLLILCYLYGWLREYGLLNFLDKPAVKSILLVIMLAWILFFASSDASDFIYFQF
ncbi:MAG TPA: MBOAT family O-acyltransferase [Spirochaetota bacterium]|nr:MBOAT family O-acyltransferase [Spirochaetota bacterium]HPF07542.1 MBOAT family O-acyltransferase [Spirochaetota bacterium]HPJ42541.1 MBOAT family O-acyltransferase [Spirochaetota bacterium]HPR37471.1 MBOAT family O-acyltransferase [Spirochaetota bacterium]